MNKKYTLYHTSAIFLAAILPLFISSCSSTGSDSSQNGTLFGSNEIGPGETFSYTFKETGTYDYFCEIHKPNMRGTVVVSNGAQISGQDTVRMENEQFQPSQVTVAPNTKVVWINKDGFAHTVISGSPSSGNNNGGNY